MPTAFKRGNDLIGHLSLQLPSVASGEFVGEKEFWLAVTGPNIIKWQVPSRPCSTFLLIQLTASASGANFKLTEDAADSRKRHSFIETAIKCIHVILNGTLIHSNTNTFFFLKYKYFMGCRASWIQVHESLPVGGAITNRIYCFGLKSLETPCLKPRESMNTHSSDCLIFSYLFHF